MSQFDVAAVRRKFGCCAYTSMGYKWTLGPMGTGFLYVRRERQTALQPAVGALDVD